MARFSVVEQPVKRRFSVAEQPPKRRFSLTDISLKYEQPDPFKEIPEDRLLAEQSPKQNVLSLLQKKYSPAVTSAMMGNFNVETGGTFDYKQKQVGGGPGTGLPQMGGGMLNAYNNYLKNSEEEDSAENQIEFIDNIIKNDKHYDIGAGNRRHLQKAFETNDPELITETISDRLLRPGKPHLDRRKSSTLEYWKELKPKDEAPKPQSSLSDFLMPSAQAAEGKRGETISEYKPNIFERISQFHRTFQRGAENALQRVIEKDIPTYMEEGQSALKLFGIRPDVALGLKEDITPQELELTQERWADVIRGSYKPLRDPQSKLAQSVGAQFLVEMAGDLLDMGTRPSTYVAWGVMERVIPKVAMAAFKKLPKGIQQGLLKERSLWGRKPIEMAYREFGLNTGAKFSDVEHVYRTNAMKFYPDRAPAGQVVNYTRKFINNEAAFEKIKAATTIVREVEKLGKGVLPHKAQVPIPFERGDVVQFGKDLGKIVSIEGGKAFLNIAGKEITANLTQLTPKPAPEAAIPPPEAVAKPEVPITPAVEPATEPIVSQAKKSVSERGIKGDDLLDVEDRIDEVLLNDKTAEIDNKGFITLYHRTTPENATSIVKSGKMMKKETSLFFGTKPEGQIEGYGETVVKVKVPIEITAINDIFRDEVHLTIPGKDLKAVKIQADIWKQARTPKAGGKGISQSAQSYIQKKGLDITKRETAVLMTKDTVVKDVNGNKVTLPEGEEYTPYRLSNNQLLLQDGESIIIQSGQLQNVKSGGVELTGFKKPLEEEGLETVVKGDETKKYTIDDIEYQGIEDKNGVKFHIVKVPDNVLQLPVTQYHTRTAALERALQKTQGYDKTKFSQYQLPGGPLSKDTEILTDNGWKRIDKVKIGDIALTRIDTGGIFEWNKVEAIPKIFAKDLYHFKSQTIDMLVTADHKMVIKRRRRNRQGIFRATAKKLWKMSECLVPLCGVNTHIGVSKLYGLDAEDVAEFFGWYISEGCPKVDNGKKSTIVISQSKTHNPNNCDRLESLFDRLNMSYKYYGNAYGIKIRGISKELVKEIHKQPKSNEKFIPPFFFKQPKNVIEKLLEGLILGDGCITKSKGRKNAINYFTKSKQLAGDVQALAVLTNKRASVRQRPSKLYTVHFGYKQWSSVDDSKHAIVDYNDYAYCVTVKNHSIYVRRNGTAAFTGNSNYKETLITAPLEIGNVRQLSDGTWMSQEADGTEPFYGKTREEALEKIQKGRTAKAFKSSHWDEPNVIAHVRTNDRTTPEGKKVLFIEELQSDWAKEVRTKGTEQYPSDYVQTYREEMAEKTGRKLSSITDKDAIDYFGLIPKGTLSHPLLKNWKELALKKVLDQAVKGGYDAISWTTGQQQADRYDLSKQIGVINWHKNESGDGKIRIDALSSDLGTQVINESFPPEELPNVIGKDVAQKIIDEVGKTSESARGVVRGEIKGLDLKTGGEWAKSLYDVQIPSILKKLAGGEISKINISGTLKGFPTFTKDRVTFQQSLELTPKVKAIILKAPKAGGLPAKREPRTIGGIVTKSGGISIRGAQAAGWSVEDIKALRPFIEEGGQSPDALAEQIAGTGELIILEGQTPSEVLKEALLSKQPTITEIEKPTPEFKRGFKTGWKEAKKKFYLQVKSEKTSTAELKKYLSDYIKEHLPLEDRGKLLTKMRDVHTKKGVLKAIELVDKIWEKGLRQDAISNLKKTIKGVDISKLSPQEAEPIKTLIKDLDLVKHREKTFVKLNKTKEYLANNFEAEMPEYVLERLSILDKKDINTFSTGDIEDIQNSILHYVHLNKVKNQIKVGKELKRRTEVLNNSISEMKPPAKVKDNIVQSQKSKIGRIKKTGKLIVDTFGIRHDHYDLIIESLSGTNSTMDKVLYQEPKEGIVKELAYKQEVYKTFHEDVDIETFVRKFKIKDIGTWQNEKVLIKGLNLTRGERMALYRHSLNEDNIRAILEGGYGLKNSDNPYKIHKMSGETLNSILESLTPAEKMFAGKPVANLFDNQGKALGKVFYDKNGYPLPLVENYYPKEVMKISLGEKQETESILEELKHKWVRVGLSKGMLKSRVKSKLPIYLNSLAYDINKSITHAAAYVGLEIPLSNASKLLYDKTFSSNLITRYSLQTYKEIEKGLRDIAGDYLSYSTVEELLLKMKNKLSTAYLGFNPFVMAKQILSYPLYNVYVKPKYLMQGYCDFICHREDTLGRHKMYSPEFAERVEGGYSRDVADVFKSGAEKRLYGGKTTIPEKMMGGIKLLDLAAVIPGTQGAVLQVLDEINIGTFSPEVKTALDTTAAEAQKLTPEEKMKLAYKFADYVTERTQPMFSPEHRSSLSRGTPIEKLATQFSSFTNQALNLIRRTYREAKRTGDPKMYAKMAKVLFYLLVVNTGGVLAIDEIRNRLFKRKGKTYGEAVLDSVASYFYFIRDIEKSVVSKVKRGTWGGFDISLPILSFANTAGDAISSGIRMVVAEKGKRFKEATKFVDKALETTLTILGTPYRTPKQFLEIPFKKEADKKGSRWKVN